MENKYVYNVIYTFACQKTEEKILLLSLTATCFDGELCLDKSNPELEICGSIFRRDKTMVKTT
jgi:hypothetical protein